MAHSSWGSGWPNCQSGRINKGFAVDTVQGRITFPGGVRHEITELMQRLVQETAKRGYKFGVDGNPSYGCWGFNCRAISGTTKPSNHSWGLALDINAPRNPMKRPLTTDMPGWMPALWKSYGFRWGGDYTTTPDAMHYEFIGSVDSCKQQTEKARANHLGESGATQPPPEEDDEEMQQIVWYTSPNGPAAYAQVGLLCKFIPNQDTLNLMKFLGVKEANTSDKPLNVTWQDGAIIVDGPCVNAHAKRIEDWGGEIWKVPGWVKGPPTPSWYTAPSGGGGGGTGALSDNDIAKIAKAVVDEDHRRSAG